MRAAVYSSKGPAAEVLRIEDVADLTPAAGEVRVRLAAAGVNPTDWKSRAYGPPIPFDFQVPGQDGAGVIDAVGPGVSESRIGERVWVFHAAWQRQWGTAAEQCVVPAGQAVPLPAGIGFDQGSGLGIPFITAHGVLTADGPVTGKTVLVAGGAGAVGFAAIQLAKAMGARVITTVSSAAKADIANSANPDVILNYTDDDFLGQLSAAAPDGVDRIVEVALGANFEADMSVLKQHGAIATYANEKVDPTITVRDLMFRNARLEFFMVYLFTDTMIDAAVNDITTFLSQGMLRSLPEIRFDLDDIARAHEAVEGNAVGKVLVSIADL